MSYQRARLVWECWEEHARCNPQRQAILHWDALGEPFSWTYGSLFAQALGIADHLARRGVKAGDVCAIIMRHNKYFYPIYMGVTFCGAIPAVLAYPNARLHPDKFLCGLSGMTQKSGLDWVITERDLESVLKPLIIGAQSSIKDILFPMEWIGSGGFDKPDYQPCAKNRQGVSPFSPFLLQHSSGTTGLQKAVVLSHNALIEQIKRYSESIKLCQDDKIVNWLPLYHDMGLIAAFHMPLFFGIPSIQIDPFQWVCSPAILFQAISAENATLTWLPNFAYNFLADRVDEERIKDIKLTSMRMFINCSEVIRYQSHEKFFDKFRAYGVKKDSLAVCYAMAEATFAVTQTKPGCAALTLAVDRDALSRGVIRLPRNGAPERVCVSSGKTISGCSMKVVGEDGVELPEDRVGNIVVKSVSLFDGYRNNPEKTAKVLIGGWYFSGDVGFLHDGECFIIGRGDDVIILAGRNVFPEDIEEAVNNVAGVIPGRVVAFGLDDVALGTEDVCVIAETLYEGKEERDALILAIKKAGMDIDVTISAVYLAGSRWLIKSSSGKLSRRENKERILSGIQFDVARK